MLEERIRKRIYDLIDERNITLYKLAQLSDIPMQTLYNINSEKSTCPKPETIEKICEGLHISMSQFYDFDDQSMYVTDEEYGLVEKIRSLDEVKYNRLIGYIAALETE